MRVNFEEIKKIYFIRKGDNATVKYVYAKLNDGSIHHVFLPHLAMDAEEDVLEIQSLDVRGTFTGEAGRTYHPGGVKVFSRLNKMTRAGYAKIVEKYIAQYE